MAEADRKRASAPADVDSINPFVDVTTPPMTERQGYLLALLAPLCAFRIFVGICGLWVYTLLLLLLQQPNAGAADKLKPQFRSYPLIIRASRAVGKLMLWSLGFTLKIKGAETLASAHARSLAPIVVANHVSYLDIFLAGAVLGPYFPVARADIAGWPVFGRLIKLWGFAGVDRKPEAKTERREKGEGLVSKLADRSKQQGPWQIHPPIIVFPEGAPPPLLGTCSTGEVLLKFKSGAFVPGMPVVPITWRYNCGPDLLAGWVWRPQPVCSTWRNAPREIAHLFRLISLRNKVVEVTVLPPHFPSEVEKSDPALFAANVRRKMAEALAVPDQCMYSVDDARAFYTKLDEEYKKNP